MKKRSLLIFYTIFIACLECIFHIRAYGDFNVIYLFLFTIPIIIFLYLLASLWRPQVNKIITHVIVVVTTIIFMAQLVYFEIYHAIFSVGAITLAGQVATFYDQILAVIEDNIIYLLLMLIPMILYFVYHNKFLNYDRKNYLECLYFAGGALLFHAMIVLSLSLNNVGVYSLYNLYHNINSPLLTSKNMGLLTEIRIDLKRTIFGFEEKLDSLIVGPTNPKPSQPEIEWNQLDIDFDAYIEEEKNENIKTMHQYFKNQSVTEKNQYTGLLKDKNVIFVLAESWDRISVDETLTPTLYQLTHEGFQFTNYYTPLFPTSTADGQYMTEWGLLPQLDNKDNLYASRKNYNPYLFPSAFSSLGYKVSAYHNHMYDFYSRGKYWEALGYDTVKFCDTGLNIPCSVGWYRGSDISLIKNSVKDYINDDKFFTYYLTVSGHGSYYYDKNPYSRKYHSYVKDLPYHDIVKNYIAANIELDRALELLIKELKNAGKLEDTVIVMTPDHWPYYFNRDNYASLKLLNQIDTIDRYETYQIHHENLVIWNPTLPSVTVEKVASSIDVLPTLLNLMGVEYDSRLLIGKDILSAGDGLAIFSDRGWISEKGTYNGETGKFTPNEGVKVSEEYIEEMNVVVNNKFKISSLVQDFNYYNKIFDKKTGKPFHILGEKNNTQEDQ